MSEDEFWALIKLTRRAETRAHAEALSHELATRPVETIHLFDRRWAEAQRAAYRWDVWNAAYLIGGGCSDDGFMDFRSWLILQGRGVYHATLNDPDSLADVMEGDDEFRYQYEVYPAYDAWKAATGGADFAASGSQRKRHSEGSEFHGWT